jgi:AcrR family transcriptional regulator
VVKLAGVSRAAFYEHFHEHPRPMRPPADRSDRLCRPERQDQIRTREGQPPMRSKDALQQAAIAVLIALGVENTGVP